MPVQIAPPARFAEAMAARGIGDGTTVIAVDHGGRPVCNPAVVGACAITAMTTSRCWTAAGIAGSMKGVKSSRATSTRPRAEFTPRIRLEPARDGRSRSQQLLKQPDRETVLVDARDPGQYSGRAAGAREAAISRVRSTSLASCSSRRRVGSCRSRKSAGESNEHGLSPDRPTVAYCNGGVAATVVLFNLARLGFADLANYDGSWNEWGIGSICRLSRDDSEGVRPLCVRHRKLSVN